MTRERCSERIPDSSFHRSENPGSPSLLPRLDVTLLLRLDLSESVRLLCAEAAAAEAAPDCSSLDLLRDLLPDNDDDGVELGGRCSNDEESVAVLSST